MSLNWWFNLGAKSGGCYDRMQADTKFLYSKNSFREGTIGMRRNVCTAYAKKEIFHSALIGAVSLLAGILIAVLTVSGSPLDFFLLNFAQNVVYIFVICFLIFSGIYLLCSGLRKFLKLETTDICRFIRIELHTKADGLTGKEMLALADNDMEWAVAFADGKVLIGKEWLFVQNSWGKPIISLENIRTIKCHKAKSTRAILKFEDQQGIGPVTRELPADEADAIKKYLQSNIPLGVV
ncbi:MAG: hypothetical protein HFF52_06795 [Lawsonibacter sp.]|nr:hypothetical protein [Lawsonibacter sp.]